MRSENKRILFQIGLFIVTFISTTMAGTEWVYGRNIYVTSDYGWQDFVNGLSFSIPLLLILTVHEFGHYFVAVYHRVKTSLPYYIPIPPLPVLSFGTLGAVIRLRSRPHNNIQHFDIGLAGPLAGFVMTLVIIVYGLATLPPQEYIFQFHPEYEQFGVNYADTVYTETFRKAEQERLFNEIMADIRSGKIKTSVDTSLLTAENVGIADIQIGKNLTFLILEKIFANPERIPNPHELMHYPILLACYIALFFTCLNLLPIGQLDGGHVVYGLFGFKWHRIIATTVFIGLIFYSGLGAPILAFDQPREEQLMWVVAYVIFLYIAFKGLRLPKVTTWMYALLMAATHLTLLFLFPNVQGYYGWVVFAFIVGRFVGISHPRSEVELPLDSRRVILGWICLLVFILCFSPAPIG